MVKSIIDEHWEETYNKNQKKAEKMKEDFTKINRFRKFQIKEGGGI
jgi:hypothetical protein